MHLGHSATQNSAHLGDDPGWHDHARDLLLLVNSFRELMPRPIVGFGHSMSCGQMLLLAQLHPRLLHGLILSEPVVMAGLPPGPNAAIFPSLRPDLWASRADAEKALTATLYFKRWDKRALRQYLAHGLRDIPNQRPKVTLVTPKAQEAWSYVRSMLTPLPADDDNNGSSSSSGSTAERLMNPHLAGTPEAALSFYRPESHLAFEALPSVRPAVLYIYGASSPLNPPVARETKRRLTGTGRGGSGGAKAGRVAESVVEGTGHMGPMEKVGEWAEAMAGWLGREAARWVEDETLLRDWDSKKSERNAEGELVLSKTWMKAVRGPADAKRQKEGASAAKL